MIACSGSEYDAMCEMTPAAQSHENTVNAFAAEGVSGARVWTDFTGTVCHTSPPFDGHPCRDSAGSLARAPSAASLLFFPFTVDDAFIVARYALNARDLGQWVFNAGEHVSAMTSPLHGLVLLGLSFVAADPIPVYKGVALLVVVTAFAATV